MKHQRKILGFLILTILLLSMLYSQQNATTNDPYLQKLTQITTTPHLFKNTEISFQAEILSIDTTNQTLRAYIQEKPYTYPPITITTKQVDTTNLQKGDLIDLVTIHTSNLSFTALKLWRNEPWKDALIYLRSLPAIPFLLYFFIRTWQFNKTTKRFERRKPHA